MRSPVYPFIHATCVPAGPAGAALDWLGAFDDLVSFFRLIRMLCVILFKLSYAAPVAAGSWPTLRFLLILLLPVVLFMVLFGKKQKKPDLMPNAKISFEWGKDEAESSLNELFGHAFQLATDAINWYILAKNGKKKWARNIRFATILLGTAAALLPTLGELLSNDNGQTPLFKAGWTAVLLGVAGALLLLDRFFGFSSGWMRYIVAELQLRQIAQEFQMDWEAARAGWQGQPPTSDQVSQMLARCKTFIAQVNTIVREETNVWVREFQSAINNLDESIKAKPAITEPGAMNLTVTNGDKVDKEWTLVIDGGTPQGYRGTTAGKPNLVPGKHQVKVEATIHNQRVQAEKVITVPAGGTCDETLTLS